MSAIRSRHLLSTTPVVAGPTPTAGEVTELLARGRGVRIERIVSTGQASPPEQWYDQEEDEWVMVLSGSAGLEIAGEGILELGAGDAVHLPAHRRHRVAWTADHEPTIWLAVFFTADAPGSETAS